MHQPQGWGGTLVLPVSGVLNGVFSTATVTIDDNVDIDCGGPRPWEILGAGQARLRVPGVMHTRFFMKVDTHINCLINLVNRHSI